jgi:hypothetical protein
MGNWKLYNVKKLKGKYLLKFLSFENTNKFLQTGNLWFARADKFGDKMECVSIRDLKLASPPIEEIEKRKRKHLISCWHLSTNESLAMWDTYVAEINKRRVLAVRFDTDLLLKRVVNQPNKPIISGGIKKLIAGKVHYKNLLKGSKELSNADMVTYVAFRKEYVFKYESEFRFVIQLKNEFDEEGLNYNIGEVSDLPFKILVNPLLESAEYLRIKEKLLSGPYKDKVEESSLAKWLKPELW